METLPLSLWYDSDLGQYLSERIAEVMDGVLSTCFGYYALYLGCRVPASTVMRGNRIRHLFLLEQPDSAEVEDATGIDACIDYAALPVASDSSDLVVLGHALSQTLQPHALLREAQRVLIPDGKLVIIDFNPVSLRGLRHLFQSWLEDAPWAGSYYTARRLKDWASLLGFELLQHQRAGHILPLGFSSLIRRSRLFSKFSGRWLDFSGAVNVLVFEKASIPLTPVRSRRWVTPRLLGPRVAPPSVGRGMKYGRRQP
jgi:SAM-dependent methyltransferase